MTAQPAFSNRYAQAALDARVFISDLIDGTIELLNKPQRDPNCLCDWTDSTEVRTAVHALLRIFACFKDDDRLVPCYPGKGARPCNKGCRCPYMIAQCLFQWDANYCGRLSREEMSKNLTGCNFLHPSDEMEAVRQIVWNHLEAYYKLENFPIKGDDGKVIRYALTGHVNNALTIVNRYYRLVFKPSNPPMKSIPAFSFKTMSMDFVDVSLSDDRIFCPSEDHEQEPIQDD